MIIDSLTAIIFILAIIQSKGRMNMALILAVFYVAHSVLFSGNEGVAYFAAGAFMDMLIIQFIATISDRSKLIDEILYVSWVSIALNIYGCCAWGMYYDLAAYNTAYIFLYSYVIFILMKDKGLYVGNHRDIELGGDGYIFHWHNN